MRFLTQLKLAGTKSFRLAASHLFEYGGNCLSGDTEVCTPVGWKRLDQLETATTALCWNMDTGKLSFCETNPVCHRHAGPLHTFEGHFHSLQYTTNHRIPYRSDSRFAWRVTNPINLIGKSYDMPVAAELPGNKTNLLPHQACLIAMLQADFSLEGNRWRGTFKKDRKCDRFFELMVANQLVVSFNKGESPDYLRPAFDAPEWVPAFLDGKEKNFHSLLDQSLETRKAFLRELAIWDGSKRTTSWTYCSTNKHNIEYVQLLAHTVGWRASVNVNNDNNRGYGCGNNKPLYRLSIKECSYIKSTTLQYKPTKEVHEKVYCLETPTGFFMTRRAGVIQITGNSQNSDKESIDIFQAPDGFSIVSVDQAGAEALVVAYLAAAGKYRELFLEGVKPHTYVALHIFIDKFRGSFSPTRYWLQRPAVLKALPEWPTLSAAIADSKFEYDIGKRTGHASNYDMGPHTYREQVLKESEGSLVISNEESRFFLDTYKAIFPEIVEEKERVKEMVRRDRTLHNLFGFPRRFEQPFTDGYMREAISWIPQSTVGCITHTAYKLLSTHVRQNRLPWRPFNNKHDSYAALVPDDHVPEAAARMVGFMAQRFTGWDGTEFTMKSEVQVGKNMKKFDKKNPARNPLGLKDYKL